MAVVDRALAPAVMRVPWRSAPPRRRVTERLVPYLFVAPALLLFLTLIAFPVVQAVRISLYDWQVLPGATSEFLGLDNYRRAMEDPRFWTSLTNAAVYMAATVPAQIVLGLLVASGLKRRSPVQPLLRVMYYLPVVTSWVVVSLLFKYLFADQGLVNFVAGEVLHVAGDTSWLSSRWTAMAAICALGVWKGIGWSMMIFLAALQGVDPSLDEAAQLDGANRWHRFRVVTLPAIWPAVVFVTVMLVIGGFNVFTSVLLMTGGGPGGQTDVLLTYMYRLAFETLDFGYAASLSVLLAGLVFVLSLGQMRAMRRDGGNS